MDDTIYRKAAVDVILQRLDALKGLDFGTVTFRDGLADGYARIISDLQYLPSAPQEIKPIGYNDCSNAMMKMWMDNVVTDGEYNRIMDKLNAYWRAKDE